MAEALAEAFVRIRPETTGFRTALTGQLRGDLRQTERETQRFARGTVVGTGALQGLGRAAAFASTAFIGGAGLVYAIRSSVKEATNQAQILANLRNALQASGFSWQQYGAQIEAATERTKRISAFDNEDLYKSLQLLIRGTGDVNKALKLNALAADVARGRNLGLVQSAQLLVRVNAGQVGSLRRLGINVEKGISGTQALIQVQKQYAGAAEAFSKTAAGAQARLTVGIQDTEKAIGRALLPTITRLEGRLADWLNKTENQKRVQRDVAAVVRDTTAVVHGLTGAIDLLIPPVRTTVRLFGGLENAVKAAALAFVGWKIAGIATSITGIGRSARTAEVGVRGLTGSLSRLKAFGVIGVTIAVGYEVAKGGAALSDFLGTTGIGKSLGIGNQRFSTGQLPGLAAAAVKKGMSEAEFVAAATFGGISGAAASAAYRRALKAAQYGPPVPAAPFTPPPGKPEGVGLAPTSAGAGRTGLGLLGRGARLQQQLANAQLTRSTADDLKALTDQSAFLNQQIAAESKRLAGATTQKQAKKFFDNLQNLKGQEASVLSQIQSIESADAATSKAKADTAARAASTARKAKAAAAKKAADDLIRAVHADAQVALTGVGKLGVDVAKLRRAFDARQKEQQRAAQAELTAQETALSIARQAADLALARAGTNQTLIGRAESLQEKADRALIRFYEKRAKAAKTVADRQAALQSKISAQIDLANLRAQKAAKKDSASSSFTLSQLYQEAESEYKLYGSNYGAAGSPLSPQQERGQFSNIVLKQKGSVNVVQNFFSPTRPSQAMNDARAGARYLN